MNNLDFHDTRCEVAIGLLSPGEIFHSGCRVSLDKLATNIHLNCAIRLQFLACILQLVLRIVFGLPREQIMRTMIYDTMNIYIIALDFIAFQYTILRIGYFTFSFVQ